MAFLCPSRLGRQKHKRDLYPTMVGRATGSDSIDALTKLELGRTKADKPESRRIILQNFTSGDPEELTVKQGQKVNFLFREGDWSYVTNDDGKEGFVPFIYCAKLGPSPAYSAPVNVKGKFEYPPSAVIRVSNQPAPSDVKKELHVPLKRFNSFSSNKAYCDTDGDTESLVQSESVASMPKHAATVLKSNSKLELPDFLKVIEQPTPGTGHICSESSTEPCGEKADTLKETVSNDNADPTVVRDEETFELCTVQYKYEGSGSDDISAEAGEIVRVIDGDDLFWCLVQKEDLTEGYIPKYYLQSIQAVSPRSDAGSSTSAQTLSSDNESTPRDKTLSDVSTDSTEVIDETYDPVVIPCNTEFMNLPNLRNTNSSRSVPKSVEIKQTPVKPPRANKPRHANRQTSNAVPGKRLSSRKSRQDRNDTSETVISRTPSSSRDSLTDSMRLELIHKEMEKLAPLQSQYSMRSSVSSFADEVFGDNVHYQLDHLHPTSAPPYKMYKYQREKDDYYDEYFYEDIESGVTDSDEASVINVAEILEIRDALDKVKEDDRKARARAKVLPHTNIASNLKQYMLTLPSTVLGNDTQPIRNTSTSGKGTRRYYVSQVEDEESAVYAQPNKGRHKQEHSNGLTNVNTSNKQINEKVGVNSTSNKHSGEMTAVNSASYNHSGERKKVGLKKHDWSFGYPRKKKDVEENDLSADINDLNKTDTTDPDNTSYISDIQDEAMEELLNTTGGLLEQSKALLSKKTRHRTAHPKDDRSHENVLGRNIEFTDATEKCNHYLTNLILGKNLLDQSSAISAEVPESDNVSSCDGSTLTNKSQVDENDNINLSHGISLDTTGKPKIVNGTHPVCDDIRGITEFVVQYDYTPTSDTAMPTVQGEVLHIGLDHQEDNEWYWAYSPRLRKYGYVPKMYVRIPMVTII